MSEGGKPVELKGFEDTKWFAKFFNRSEERIRQLADMNIMPKKRYKGVNYYEIIPSMQNYIKYLQEIVDNRKRTSEDQEKEKLEADIRYKRAKANKAEIDLEVFKNNLIPSEIVKAYIEDLGSTTRALLLGLPGRLAIDVMKTGNPSEAAEVIKSALSGVLVELANCEFSIEAYKERVSETQTAGLDEDDELD